MAHRTSASAAVLLLVAATVACLAPLHLAHAAPPARPSFVFVFADDWGNGDTSPYHTLLNRGPDLPATPRIERLAQEGTVFSDFHTLGAECSPSRASWLTGRSPSDAAVRIHLVLGSRAQNRMKGNADFLNASVPTVTSVMNNSGYRTGHFGKWHLGMLPPGPNASQPRAPPLAAYGINDAKCYVCPQEESQYDTSDLWWPSNSSRLIVDDALTFIQAAVADNKPFYLNMWFHISHEPMHPTDAQVQAYAEWVANRTSSSPSAASAGARRGDADGASDAAEVGADGTARGPVDPMSLCPPGTKNSGYTTCPVVDYRASQFEADAQIGRFLDALDAMQWPGHDTGARGGGDNGGSGGSGGSVGDNTLVVFSGDNGPEDGHIYFNSVGDPGPYRGRKRSLYEGGVRMPLIARWPARMAGGGVCDGDLMSADWLPTVASLAGATVPDPAPLGFGPLMGRDAGGFFDPKAPTPPARIIPKMFDYRADGYGHCWNQAPRLAIRDGELKLLMNPDRSRVELYNLTASPFEADNLAVDMPDEVARLAAQLDAWQATVPQSPLMKATHMGCLAYRGP